MLVLSHYNFIKYLLKSGNRCAAFSSLYMGTGYVVCCSYWSWCTGTTCVLCAVVACRHDRSVSGYVVEMFMYGEYI
jgi:hypothetical protein